MCGTAVRKYSSTSIRPRLSAVRPAASRLSSSVTPCRPAEYMTVSAGIFFPLSRVAMRALRPGLDRGHRLAEPEGDGEVAQVVLERLDDLHVAELEHPLALLDHGDLGAEGGEHGRVLDADHAGAGHHHRARDRLQVNDPVGVDDGALVELDTGRAGRPGAGGDDDLVRGGPADPAVAAVHFHRVRVDEAARSGQVVTRLRDSWLRTTSISRPTTWLVRAARSAMVISSLTR